MRVYFYGIEPELRPLTWPYLLRVVEWHEDLDVGNMDTIKKDYERDTTEWLEIELELIEMEKNGNGGGRGEFLAGKRNMA
jgi:predicted adenine nucleotide alpha hydrolase (AANH) superfamily ATPase